MTNLRAPINSEEAIALDFASRHLDEIRYVDEWKMWFQWDGKRWCVDKTRKIFSLARELCRETANGQNKATTRKAIASAKTRAAVVSLAGEDRALAATIDQWDADPWLLNTPGGVVDLRTGKMRPALAQDYMTKITAVAPGGECPLWHQCLEKSTGGNVELQKYLQRWLGYDLTGSIIEEALAFLYGTGANGKGVLMGTVAGVMGDYHVSSPIETFTASHTDRHPTELARLRGARLVTTTETEEGRNWAEARIKAITGGDPIDARFMRQDFFTYLPQFKLMASGNHKPNLRGVDEAIRRRFNIIPFTVTIPLDERDLKLKEKLKAEWPGILKWMIRGCLDWQQIGLAPPEIVRVATKEYLADQDVLQTWLDECCFIGKQHQCSVGDLFSCWSDWTEVHKETTGSSKRFSQRIEASGFERQRGDVRGFLGLTVWKAPETPSDPSKLNWPKRKWLKPM